MDSNSTGTNSDQSPHNDRPCANTPETALTQRAVGLSKGEEWERGSGEEDGEAMGRSAVGMDSCVRNEMRPCGLLSLPPWLCSLALVCDLASLDSLHIW